MEITIELIEKVLDATNADYKVVKQALIDADGDADAAIGAIKAEQAVKAAEAEELTKSPAGTEEETEAASEDTEAAAEGTEAASDDANEAGQDEAGDFDWTSDWTTDKFADDMVEQLKKRVKEGNVDRIVITKDDKTILNIPVNLGIVGGLIGFALIPWAVIFAALAAYGLNCKVKIVTSDGKDEEL